VARRGNLLIFVEVKARGTFDDAAYSVTLRQQQRIAAAAAIWLADNASDAQRDMRFDAILVAPRCWPRHIEAAFEVESGGNC
ncbi:MAG TPA: YraN family protein, partial [Pseudorhodoplanes sp.]|nr:YraN family protein [Pseudorhodoplanes sp.]